LRRQAFPEEAVVSRALQVIALLLVAGSPALALSDLHFDKVVVEETSSPNYLWDNTLEPGERARLVLWLLNLRPDGAPAVTASLASLTPGITVHNASAVCGDLEPDELTACASPAWEIEIPADTPCGTVLDFQAETFVQGAPGPAFPFSLRVGLRRPVRLTDPIRLTDKPLQPQIMMDMTRRDDGWGLTWQGLEALVSFEVYAAPLLADGTPAGAIPRVSPTPDWSGWPAVASDGQGLGVVWLDDRDPATGYGTFFAYLDASGNVLLEREIHRSPNASDDEIPAVAWDGEAFGIAGSQSPVGLKEAWFLRVDAEGDILTPFTIVRSLEATEGFNRVSIYALIWTGSGYVLFTRVMQDSTDFNTREVYFLGRDGSQVRLPTVYSCYSFDETEGNYKCLGHRSGIAWNGRGFGTVQGGSVSTRDALLFQRLDALGRPDGPHTRITEPDITTPWHQGEDVEELSGSLTWDGFGWGALTVRIVRNHWDPDCPWWNDPLCECLYGDFGTNRFCDPGQQILSYVAETGRRLVPEIPLNPPFFYSHPAGYGCGKIAWNGRSFGVGYTESRNSICGVSDPLECGDIDFLLASTEPWCPGPPPPEISPPSASTKLLLERVGQRDIKALWEDLSAAATSYNLYYAFAKDTGAGLQEATVFYSHNPWLDWQNGAFRPACHVQGSLEADGRRSFILERAICGQPSCPPQLLYFLVSASNEHGEGPLGFDSMGRERAPERKVCLEDP